MLKKNGNEIVFQSKISKMAIPFWKKGGGSNRIYIAPYSHQEITLICLSIYINFGHPRYQVSISLFCSDWPPKPQPVPSVYLQSELSKMAVPLWPIQNSQKVVVVGRRLSRTTMSSLDASINDIFLSSSCWQFVGDYVSSHHNSIDLHLEQWLAK